MLAIKHQELSFFFLNWCSLWMDFDWYHGFSSSHIQMWELIHKKGWAPKNWWFHTVMLEKTVESPLDSKEIKPVNVNKSTLNIHWKDWYWSWRSNTLATWWEEPTLEKTLMLEKIEGWRRRWLQRMRRLDGIIDSVNMSLNKLWEGQGSLPFCSPWGRKESEPCATELSDRTMYTLGFMN